MNNRDELLAKVNQLVHAYKHGMLGGEKMPEDENPGLEKGSKQIWRENEIFDDIK